MVSSSLTAWIGRVLWVRPGWMSRWIDVLIKKASLLIHRWRPTGQGPIPAGEMISQPFALGHIRSHPFWGFLFPGELRIVLCGRGGIDGSRRSGLPAFSDDREGSRRKDGNAGIGISLPLLLKGPNRPGKRRRVGRQPAE